MNSLITGGKGAAGSYLAEHLKESGDKVSILARPECDLLDFNAVCERLADCRPDAIYHLASDADVSGSFSHVTEISRNNIMGTVHLFEAVRKLKMKCAIQVCSTSEVYGNPWIYPIKEDALIDPVNPYAFTKASQDLLGGVYAKSYLFRVVRTRAFGYINPRRANLSLTSFARQIVAIERGQQDKLRHGNLDSIRTFCDVRDIAVAYRLAIEKEGVFNIGSEKPISIGEALEMLVGYAKCEIELEQDHTLMRPVDVTDQIPDCTRFRRATGWEPEITLEESLQWLLSTCRASV